MPKNGAPIGKGEKFVNRYKLSRWLLIGILITIFGVGFPAVAQAAEIVVETDTGEISDDGDCSLPEAIINANDDDELSFGECEAGDGDDTIIFADTLSSRIISLSAELVISDTVTIDAAERITITTSATDLRLMRLSGADFTVTLRNLGFTGGNVIDDDGGAIKIVGAASLRLVNCTFENNSANNSRAGLLDGSTGEGGALFAIGANIIITNTTFANNSVSSASGREHGGAISTVQSTLIITNSTFNSNFADNFGGAIKIEQGNTTIADSAVEGNRAQTGAGIYLAGLSVLLISNSTISNNIAVDDDGGGIYNTSNGNVTIQQTLVSNNEAASRGGGIFNNGSLSLSNSLITGNSADDIGGGISNFDALTIVNTTISNNTSDTDGGGLSNEAIGDAKLTNVTIMGNFANLDGGGIFDDVITSGPTVTLTRTIVSGNTSNAAGHEIFQGRFANIQADEFNLFGDSSAASAEAFDGFSTSGSDILATSDGTSPTALDEILSPLDDNGGPTQTHALPPGSPAIDAAGDCAADVPTDQRGESRPQGTACDIGAYEAPAIPAIAVKKTIGTSPGSCTLFDDLAFVAAGTDVFYCIRVTNTGNATLTSLTINDSQLGIINETLTVDLAPDADSLEITSADIDKLGPVTITEQRTNTVSVTASDGTDTTDPVEATATVFVPSLTLTKTVGTTSGECGSDSAITVDAGTEVFYCLTLENTGDGDISDIVISDPQLGLDNASVSIGLIGGETITLLNTSTFIFSSAGQLGDVEIDDDVTNTAIITGVATLSTASGSSSITVSASDSATVAVPNYSVSVTANPATQTVSQNTTISITASEANGGSVDGLKVVAEITGANPITRSGNTAADGSFSFEYSGATADTDTITAWIDLNDNDLFDASIEPSNTATVTWTDLPPVTGSISGTIICESTQSPLVGVDISLTDASGQEMGNQQSGTNGEYAFTGRTLGTYTVIVDPSTITGACTTPASDPEDPLDNQAQVTLTEATPNRDNIDFGYEEEVAPVTGSIAGTITCASTQTPIVGVSVQLSNATGPVGNSQPTLADGTYRFADLALGQYTVTVNPATISSGCNQPADDVDGTLDNQTTVALSTTDPDSTGVDFEYEETAPITGSISGSVTCINDRSPLVGVSVTATSADGFQNTLSTAADGSYRFGELALGTYAVSVDPSTITNSCNEAADDPDDGFDNTAMVDLNASIVDVTGQDFIYESPPLASIGDTVTCASTGQGIPNVTLTLSNSFGFSASNETDQAGTYAFDVSAGTYTLDVDTSTLPADCNVLSAAPDSGPDSSVSVTVNAGDINIEQDFVYVAAVNNLVVTMLPSGVASMFIGQEHTLSAQVERDNGSQVTATSGVEVSFMVGAPDDPNRRVVIAESESNGVAEFDFVRAINDDAVDQVIAWVDSNNNSEIDAGEPVSAASEISWMKTDVRFTGRQIATNGNVVTRRVDATVHQFGDEDSRVADVEVSFAVTGDTQAESPTKNTDAQGQVFFDYPSIVPEQNTVQASSVDDVNSVEAVLVETVTVWLEINGVPGFQQATEPGLSVQPIVTAVELADFAVVQDRDKILLQWRTLVEVENAGFNLYRASSPSGPFTRINEALIAGQGMGIGTTYEVVDAPPAGGSYVYQLEDVDFNGVGTVYGPIGIGSSLYGSSLSESQLYMPLFQR